MSTLVGTSNIVGDRVSICKGAKEAAGHDEEKKDGASVSFVETEISPGPGQRSSGARGFNLFEERIASDDIFGDRRFENLDEVHDLLGELGVSDSKYKLDNNGFAVLPGKRHIRATIHLGKQLDGWNKGWSKGWLGSWGEVSNDNVMQVPGFTPSGRQKRREPDVAFWAYPRCEKIDGTYVAKDRPDGANFDVDPEVVFQFSDGNTFAKEEEAMNLIMIGGVGAGNEGPRVGFLLKLREVPESTVGIDIYKVPRGRTVADAMNQAKGATHMEIPMVRQLM